MLNRCSIFFRCAVSLFIISLPLYAVETAIPQPLLDWQKAAQAFTAQGDLSGAAQYYQKIIQFNTVSSNPSVTCKAMPTMPQNLYELAGQFEACAQVDKSMVFYQASVNWSADSNKAWGIWNDPAFYQMLSQAGIIRVYIRNKDFSAAQAAFNLLTTRYADQPTLSKEIYLIAENYAQAGQQEKVFEMYQFNVDRSANINGSFKPVNMWWDPEFYRMRSLAAVICRQIRNLEYSVSESGCEILRTRYAGQPTLPKEIFQIAQEYQKAGQVEKAVALYQANVQLPVPAGDAVFTPQNMWDDPEVYRMWSQKEIAISCLNRKDYDEALKNSLTIVEQYAEMPQMYRCICSLADEFIARKQADKALVLCETALANNADNCTIIWIEGQRIRAVLKTAQIATADAAAQQVVQRYADCPEYPAVLAWIGYEYSTSGQTAKAIQFCTNAESAVRNKTSWEIQAECLMYLGKAYVRLGDEDKVQHCIDALILGGKESFPAGYLCAIADEYYRVAFTDDTRIQLVENSPAIFNKAIAIWQLPQWTDDISPKDEATLYIGSSYQRMGQYDKAIDAYRKLLEAWPNFKYVSDALNLMGICYADMAEQCGNDPNRCMGLTVDEAMAEAQNAWQTVIDRHPDTAMSYDSAMRLAQTKEQKGQWQAAAEMYEFFLSRCGTDSRKTKTIFNLGNAYEQAGLKEPACAAYRECIQMAAVGDKEILQAAGALLRLEGVK